VGVPVRRAFTFTAASLLAAALSAGGAPRHEPKEPAAWQTLRDCELDPNAANDGDSFHVLHQGREYIFRLYFVDTPEVDDLVPERVKEQARHWSIPERKVADCGRDAADATRALLRRSFTVYTRMEDARGQSSLPRYYALIRCADGKWLAETLVEAGWARVYGESCALPDGTSGRDHFKQLDAAQDKARKARRGVWRLSAPHGRSGKDGG
jgi:endonuclease YncB( thermonuclease family)